MPAPKIVNWEGGSDARYDTSQMWPSGDGRLTDGVYYYDGEGRPLDAIPGGNEWTQGLPGARGGNSPMSMGGGGNELFSLSVNSPFYQQAQAATQAAAAADAAARRAAIQQALIQFGLIPANFQDRYGDVDDTTRNLAQQNTSSGISVSARLTQALQDAQRNSSRRLAARGLRRSGARGYQMRRNQLGFDQSYSDAVSQLLGGVNRVYGDFAQNEYSRSMSLAQALQNAISSMSGFGSYKPSSFSAPSPPSTQSFSYQDYSPGATGTPTIGGGVVGDSSPNFSLGGGSGTSSKKPLLF